MAEYKPPKHRIFNGKQYTLSAGTRHGSPTKKHAMSVVEMNKKYGYKHYRLVKKGNDYYAYMAK